jgi:hypothetical protein
MTEASVSFSQLPNSLNKNESDSSSNDDNDNSVDDIKSKKQETTMKRI